MIGLAILIGFYFLGMVIQQLTNIPIPANVIGLILFTICLFTKIIKLEWVEASAQFLLRHMLLFFVPYVVGVVVFYPIIQQSIMAVLFGLVLSSLATLVVIGLLTQKIERRSDAS